MIAITLRPALHADIAPIAANMRAMDVLECKAFGHDPETGLRLGLEGSREVLTILKADRPIASLGVLTASSLEATGRPWLLGTDQLLRERRAWAMMGPTLISRIARGYRLLENLIHRENTASIRWLERLGFTIDPDIQPVGGEPFRRFWRAV